MYRKPDESFEEYAARVRSHNEQFCVYSSNSWSDGTTQHTIVKKRGRDGKLHVVKDFTGPDPRLTAAERAEMPGHEDEID